MAQAILIVDKEPASALAVLDELNLQSYTDVTFVDTALQGIKCVKKNAYDIIILGDRTQKGSIYDVALEIKDSKRNRQVATVCVGVNTGKVARIEKLLNPFTLAWSAGTRKVVLSKLSAYLQHRASKEVKGE